MITWILKTIELVETDQNLKTFEIIIELQNRKVFTNHNKLQLKPPEKDCQCI